MSGEDQSGFNLLHDGLLAEHRPPSPPKKSSFSKWPSNFFSFARAENFLAGRLGSSHQIGDSKEVALIMRYQNAADRHVNRNLNDIRKIQKERRLQEIGSVSSTPRSQTPLLILPPRAVRRHHLSFRRAQRDATTYPSNQPRAIGRYRSTTCNWEISVNHVQLGDIGPLAVRSQTLLLILPTRHAMGTIPGPHNEKIPVLTAEPAGLGSFR
jgi:hypothetical protein